MNNPKQSLSAEGRRKNPPRAKRIPLEFLLLDKIVRRYRTSSEGQWAICTKTQITRHFLYSRLKESLNTQEFYHRVLPEWIRRGLAREIPRPGKPAEYMLRPMTLNEVNLRLREVQGQHDKWFPLYNDPARAEYHHPDIFARLSRLQDESRGLKISRRARMDDQLNVVKP